MGADGNNIAKENIRGSKYLPNSRIRERCGKSEEILMGLSIQKMFPNIFSKSLAAKTYFMAQLLHLFPNTKLDDE